MAPQGYSMEERAFIAAEYHKSKSVKDVQRRFHAKYGYRKTPHRDTVLLNHSKLFQQGDLRNKKAFKEPTVVTLENRAVISFNYLS